MKKKIAAMLSAESDEWGTPRRTFEHIDRSFGFNLDAAATKANALCSIYITKEENALRRTWAGTTFWLNFPYSMAAAFTKHARLEAMKPGTSGVLLSPVRPDTEWWRDNVLQLDGGAGALRTSRFMVETGALWLGFERLIVGVRWLKGRLTFRPPAGSPPPDPAPFPSAVIVLSHPGKRPRLEGTEWTKGWPV